MAVAWNSADGPATTILRAQSEQNATLSKVGPAPDAAGGKGPKIKRTATGDLVHATDPHIKLNTAL